MVSMAPEGAVSVEGGNWRIFAEMVKSATSDVHFETAVDKITSLDNGTFKISAREINTNETLDSWFDEVIIATPFQFSNLTISPKLESTPEEVPYVTLHVTLFTSPRLLSPAAFNLNPGATVPLVVLTTLDPTEEPGTKTPYAGKAGFFSISLLQPITNPATNEEEYLYKIFSPSAVTPEFLARILGIEHVPKDIGGFDKADVSWVHLKVWKSYPVEYPRVTFEQIELAPGLYYTGGMDSFISCMETNALMGMNVARLMVDKWIGEKTLAAAIQPEIHEEQFGVEGQKILNGA
jgi:prenylcysteine oxidase/farnesylcysteine lyase